MIVGPPFLPPPLPPPFPFPFPAAFPPFFGGIFFFFCISSQIAERLATLDLMDQTYLPPHLSTSRGFNRKAQTAAFFRKAGGRANPPQVPC